MRVADLRKGALALLSIGLAALLLLDAPPASAGLGEDRWLNIDGLSTAIRPNPRGASLGVGKVKVKAINQADRDLVGPLRIVITRANREVLNADGYTAGGDPFFLVSESEDFVLASGDQSPAVRVEFKRLPPRALWSFWKRGQLLPRFEAVAEYRPPFTLQLLHAADMDGATGALDNVKGFSAVLEALRSELPEHSLTLSSGDNYIPGPRFAAAADDSLAGLLGIPGEGRGDMGFLNAMGFQASAAGNHEFDAGTGSFAGIIDLDDDGQGNVYPGAQFPYLSTNIDWAADSATSPLTVADGLPAELIPNSVAGSTVISVGGELIGVVGASTPSLPSITSIDPAIVGPVDRESVPALASAIQSTVDALTARGIDKIVLLAHMQQIAVEIQLATLLEDVDVIVAGGSNTLLADSDDVLRGGDERALDCVPAEIQSVYGAECSYPITLASPKGEPVLVVNTDGDYTYVGRLVAGFDGRGVLVEETLDPLVNGAYATDENGVSRLGGPEPDPTVAAIADALTAVLVARDGNILGQTAVYLDGRRSQVRTQETNMGNLSADANLWVAGLYDPDTVISIKNGGGIRDDIGYFVYPPGSTDPADLEFFPPAANQAAGKAEGDISQFDIQGTLRFNNNLTLLTVTAAELQAIVEHGVAATAPGATPGQFPQVAGLRFSFDPTRAPNARVRNLAVVDGAGNVLDVVVRDGVLEGDPARSFRLVTLGFLANGGDDYPFPATNRVDLDAPGLLADELGSVASAPGRDASFASPGTEQDALSEYLQEFFDPVLASGNAAYPEAEVPAADDLRIQNLFERADTVLP
ncbi:MAG: bifunctional metallophosphatase/5'-nucleotidase [Chromatiales bacterium]|jgi:2',3'-cyclic-nucleotide 2'-phosphodiesterase (5'-nucleotidase family)